MNEPEQHTDLDDRLRRLAAGLAAPDVPADDDVSRGRRRLVRQRLAIGGACLATATALGLGAVAAPGIL
ncbi:MAG: hypothetical protein JWO76_567, partial [Nocardioides sp.]|nr:hypothetical protein [Nocardioides sp.]